MGRRLPWKTTDDAARPSPQRTPKTGGSPAPPGSSSRFTPTPRRRRAPEPRLDSVRSPSTSPPPAPPQERLMLPGALADDRYRMVEDELLHTARRFTTHLHRAEYDRLKARAESQNAAAIRAIARPVVGPLTASARARREAAAREAKQCAMLGDAEPWAGTTLQGLMECPRRQTRSISSYAPAHSTTRAAAGYKPTTGSLASRRGNSLNASPAPSTPAPSRVPARPRSSTIPRRQAQHSTPSASRDPGTLAPGRAGHHTPPSRGGSARDTTRDGGMRDRRHAEADLAHAGGNDDDDDDDDPFGIGRRKSRREQSRKPGDGDPPRKLSPDTIPSFL